VLEPEYGIVAIGSGGAYAQAAARALLQHTEMAPPTSSSVARDRRRHLHLHEPEPHRRDEAERGGPAGVRRPMSMTPQEIVSELDRHIVGQNAAKRAVAIALRNRWRRQQVDEKLRGEITPKNILMIGPTGVGKTEIARRLARLADAPFIKVEATKFTEVGYVGKDVDTIVRDLMEVAVKQERERQMRTRAPPPKTPPKSASWTPWCRRLRAPRGNIGFANETARRARQHRPPGAAQAAARRHAGDKEIEIDLADPKPTLEMLGPQGMPGMEEMAEQLKGLFSQMGQGKRKTRKLKIGEALPRLIEEEAGRWSTKTRSAPQRWPMPKATASSSSTRSTRWLALRPRRRRSQPPGCAARPAAAGGRHHGQHQVRHGQDRPHAVHRQRRLPPGQAQRPDPRAAGPLSDPRGTGLAERGRLRGHSDQHPGQPDHAVQAPCWPPKA
jgi:hypothetical protein